MLHLLSRVLVCVILCSVAGSCATSQTFHGHLGNSLKVDSSSGSVLLFDAAPQALAKTLGLNPEQVSRLYRGKISLGVKPELQFGAAVADLKDGTALLFIDGQTGNGVLQRIEHVSFSTPSQPYYSAEADFQIKVPHDRFRKIPVYAALPKSIEGYQLKAGQFALIVGNRPYVEGSVDLPSRTLLVRYAYDVDAGSVPLDKEVEWFDVDGNGKIDLYPGSPERGVPDKAAPIFNVGGIALQTASIDIRTHHIVLRQVPIDAKRISLVVGSQVPDFSYQGFDGKQHRFSELKARYTLLDFWATWCVPCVADLPSKREAYQRFHDKGFEILGMDGDADKAKAEDLLRKVKATWPEAKPDSALLQERFKITAWPTLILIDDAGKIVSTNQADHLPLSGSELQRTLAALLP